MFQLHKEFSALSVLWLRLLLPRHVPLPSKIDQLSHLESNFKVSLSQITFVSSINCQNMITSGTWSFCWNFAIYVCPTLTSIIILTLKQIHPNSNPHFKLWKVSGDIYMSHFSNSCKTEGEKRNLLLNFNTCRKVWWCFFCTSTRFSIWFSTWLT